MSSSILLVIAFSILILALTHNVQGFALKVRDKRMTYSQSDKNNVIRHEVRIKIGASLCSGTIIADEYILTAAHCFTTPNTNKIIDYKLMEVTAGIKNVYDRLELHTVRLVEKIYIPRYFNNSDDTQEAINNIIGDIAVVKLNYGLGLEIDPRIEALKLPTKENNENDFIIFSGFGHTNHTAEDYDKEGLPHFVQYSKAKVYEAEKCVKVRNATLQICALLERDNAGVCGGDSGGALFDLKGRTVIGVLSTGSTFCYKYAGTYTKVLPHKQFITNAINGVADEMARVRSYEKDEQYRKTLRQSPWKYHWIYTPDVKKDSLVQYSA